MTGRRTPRHLDGRVSVGVTLNVEFHRFSMSSVCTRTYDATKCRLHIEVDGGSGGCWGGSVEGCRPDTESGGGGTDGIGHSYD